VRTPALLLRRMRPSSRKRPTCEHVVWRESLGALGAHPALERGDKGTLFFWRAAKRLAAARPLVSRSRANNCVDAFDNLQSDRRDRRRSPAAQCIDCDVPQLQELAPGVAPAQNFEDWGCLALAKIEAIVALEYVGLQNAGVSGQVPLGMRARPIARGAKQRRAGGSLPPNVIERHVPAAERLHGDDTTVPILAKGQTETDRVWVYLWTVPRSARVFASIRQFVGAAIYRP